MTISTIVSHPELSELDEATVFNQSKAENLEGINQLPPELLQCIFSFLNLRNERTLLVNREWKASTLEAAKFQKVQDIKAVMHWFMDNITSEPMKVHLQNFLDSPLLPPPISFSQIQFETEKIEDGLALILKNLTKQEAEELKQELNSSANLIEASERRMIGKRVLDLSEMNAKLEAIDKRLSGAFSQTLLDLADMAIDFAKIGRLARALEMSESISKKFSPYKSINPKDYASHALRVISKLLVDQEKLEQAIAVARRMACPWRQRLAFQAILKAYLSLNLVDRALEVSNFMSGSLGKSAELLGIVNERVANGRFEEAIKIVCNIPNPIHKSFAYGCILRGLIGAGRTEEAKELAQKMPENDWQKSQAQAVIQDLINPCTCKR